MKKYLAFLLFNLMLFTLNAQEVNWISFEEAVAITKEPGNTKKVFIDVYTDWCGWCKRMDADTFQNPEVAAYMQENFLMVKFDAEGKEPIQFDGREFNYVASGRRGYHELAVALLKGRLSYPTVVFMDEEFRVISPVPGYHKPDKFIKIARFFGDDVFKEQDWETYSQSGE